eukprot:6153462-Amphidinium_carterae.1
MAVEAREQTLGPHGLKDAAITHADHPLVRYVEELSRHFELVAERRSVIFHLRELARATVLAKFLLEAEASDESIVRFPPIPGSPTPNLIISSSKITDCSPKVQKVCKHRAFPSVAQSFAKLIKAMKLCHLVAYSRETFVSRTIALSQTVTNTTMSDNRSSSANSVSLAILVSCVCIPQTWFSLWTRLDAVQPMKVPQVSHSLVFTNALVEDVLRRPVQCMWYSPVHKNYNSDVYFGGSSGLTI